MVVMESVAELERGGDRWLKLVVVRSRHDVAQGVLDGGIPDLACEAPDRPPTVGYRRIQLGGCSGRQLRRSRLPDTAIGEGLGYVVAATVLG